MAKDLGIVSSLGLSNHLTITELKMTDLHSNADLVRSLFFYRDGNLYWKKQVNTRTKIGTRAGCLVGGGGRAGLPRYKVKHEGKMYRVHRLIYLMHHNVMPKVIDHIDGNPHNNRIENLREASLAQNAWNQKLGVRNKSGVKGVFWDNTRRKWHAKCMANGKYYHVGYFKDLEEARMTIEKFRAELHGEFARNA